MTHDREPCHLVPNMANNSSIRALSHWHRVAVWLLLFLLLLLLLLLTTDVVLILLV